MKATGIVRRIDDLGRVVIPKEIRRTLKIREGDPLEIFTLPSGEVVFKKYSPVGEISQFAAQYADVLYKVISLPTLICDRERVIASAGVPKKDYMEKGISNSLNTYMENRQSFVFRNGVISPLVPLEDTSDVASVMYPIISGGDVFGQSSCLNLQREKIPQKRKASCANPLQPFWENRWKNKLNTDKEKSGRLSSAAIP